MTRIGSGLFLALALASGAPAAEPCAMMCGVQRTTCVQTARVTKLACTETCGAASDPASLGRCMRSCSSAFRTARTNCRFQQQGCLDGCGTPAGAPACVGSCGHDLDVCIDDVTGTARRCLTGCRAWGRSRACVAGCTMALRAGTAFCRSTLGACKAGCTSASPGGAFLG